MNTSGKGASLTDIIHGKADKEDVKKILGEPTIITVNNETGQEIWQYKDADFSGVVTWDNRNNRLEKFNCVSKETTGNRDPNNAALLTGSATFPEAVAALGVIRKISRREQTCKESVSPLRPQ